MLEKWDLWWTESIEIFQMRILQSLRILSLLFRMANWKKLRVSVPLTTGEIAKQDYILTPGRYVGIEEQEDDGEPFNEKMKRLTSELSEMFEKSHELENEIREKLGAIGYDI